MAIHGLIPSGSEILSAQMKPYVEPTTKWSNLSITAGATRGKTVRVSQNIIPKKSLCRTDHEMVKPFNSLPWFAPMAIEKLDLPKQKIGTGSSGSTIENSAQIKIILEELLFQTDHEVVKPFNSRECNPWKNGTWITKYYP